MFSFSALVSDFSRISELHSYIHWKKNRKKSPPSPTETSKLCSSNSHSLCGSLSNSLFLSVSQEFGKSVAKCWANSKLVLLDVSFTAFSSCLFAVLCQKLCETYRFCAPGICCLPQFWGPSGKVVEVGKPGCSKDHSAAFHMESFCTSESYLFLWKTMLQEELYIFSTFYFYIVKNSSC